MLEWIPRAVALATALTPLQTVGAGTSAPTLADLERRVDSAYSVQAGQRHIASAQFATTQARAASGLKYVGDVYLGQRSYLVTQQNHGSRYTQDVGVGYPIWGGLTAEREAIVEAQHNEALASADLLDTRRALLTKLRDSYIMYWQFQQTGDVDARYLSRSQQDVGPARSLVRSGFWTSGKLLDFLDVQQRLRSDMAAQQSSARGQLAGIRSVAGEDIQAFRAGAPAFGTCETSADAIVARATAADPEIAQIDAQIAQYQADLGLVKHSAAVGNATLTTGLSVDPGLQNSGSSVAYSLNAGASASMPTHGRSEEKAKRASLEAAIDEQNLLRKQRVRDITAAVESALDDISAAQVALDQSIVDQRARAEDLREAQVKFQTQRMDTHPLFEDIQTALAQTYEADKTVVTNRALLWMKSASLLELDPRACQPNG